MEQHTLLPLRGRLETVAEHLHDNQWNEQTEADIYGEVVLVGHANSATTMRNFGCILLSVYTTPIIHKPGIGKKKKKKKKKYIYKFVGLGLESLPPLHDLVVVVVSSLACLRNSYVETETVLKLAQPDIHGGRGCKARLIIHMEYIHTHRHIYCLILITVNASYHYGMRYEVDEIPHVEDG